MNEQANGQLKQPAQSQANGGADRSGGYGEAPRFTVDKASGKTAGKKNEAVLGPFTIRDLTVFGSTLILFVASLIPMFAVRYNLWNLGSLFFLGLGILLPVIVAALFVARRLSPGTKIRIGSLSVDQFGSVVASFAVAFFFLAVAGAYRPQHAAGPRRRPRAPRGHRAGPPDPLLRRRLPGPRRGPRPHRGPRIGGPRPQAARPQGAEGGQGRDRRPRPPAPAPSPAGRSG